MTTVTTLSYTGAVQDVTIAPGCYSVQIEWWGAEGGTGDDAGVASGKGGYTKGMYATTPGTVLHNYVGGAGDSPGSGGWNGGGDSHTYAGKAGGGGGGASDTRVGGTTLSKRIGVAGGGGGAGAGYGGFNGSRGGDGGGAVGQDGGYYDFSDGGPRGGTQTTGNALGVGGSTPSGGPAGGGGGGWWGGYAAGGGSGAAWNGGGGGSGNTGTLTGASMLNGIRSGNGQIVITTFHQPNLAPTPLGPPNNGYAIASVANAFTWTFNGDVQTSADFRWKPSGGSWTTVTGATTIAKSYTVAAATFSNGQVIEWQVMTYDSLDLASPWSASSFVNIVTALPSPTITVPAEGASVFATPVTVEWTLPSGYSCRYHRVQRNSLADGSGTMYYDSGIVDSTGLTASVPIDATAGRTDFLRVSYWYYGHWSPYGISSFVDQYGPPHTPTVTCVADPATASVAVTIGNAPASDGYADTVANDLIRTGIDGVSIPIARLLPPNAVYVDREPGAGLINFTATAYAASGATSSSAI